jgi:L-methionine (R)-S-oxide reductase
MAEEIILPNSSDRSTIYKALLPQIKALINDESNTIANLANVVGALKQTFDFFWVGFYLVSSENDLVLGPFQGPIACTRIPFDKGVCGHCYTTQKVIIVPDVEQFPGHIACSSASKSEIVLPLINTNGKIIGVLDVDSDKINDFSEEDSVGLQSILDALRTKLS